MLCYFIVCPKIPNSTSDKHNNVSHKQFFLEIQQGIATLDDVFHHVCNGSNWVTLFYVEIAFFFFLKLILLLLFYFRNKYIYIRKKEMGYNTKTHHKLHSKALESKLLLVWDLDLISKLFLWTSQVRRVKVKHSPSP